MKYGEWRTQKMGRCQAQFDNTDQTFYRCKMNMWQIQKGGRHENVRVLRKEIKKCLDGKVDECEDDQIRKRV